MENFKKLMGILEGCHSENLTYKILKRNKVTHISLSYPNPQNPFQQTNPVKAQNLPRVTI